MTSIAASLAAQAGASLQEGQTATQANALGAPGPFAALFELADAAQAPGGETAHLPDATGLPAAKSDGQAIQSSNSLREALTQGLGLPRDGADVEAAIIEGQPDKAAQGDPLLTAVRGESEGQASQAANALVQTATPELSEEVMAHPVYYQERNAPDEARSRPRPDVSGIENALGRAAQTGKENGLQTALSQAAQARGAGGAQQQGAVPGEQTPEAAHRQASGAADDMPAIKPGPPRSEFTPKGPEIVQRLIKAGNGQPTIRIVQRTVGENAGASSPPTLTVSVQAPAASPGPASANAPHVPVSALAVHIAQQASNGARRFDIRLDPPELGRIEVRLDVARDGQVMTHLVVERAETLDLLQRDARQLERALQNAGLNMSEEDMKFSLKDQGLADGGDDGFNNEDEKAGQDRSEGDNDLARISDDAMPPPTRYMAASGLDIRI